MANKAILLGINDYKSVSGLRGCENDVLNMKGVLTGVLGFDASNIKVLLHTEVTKSRIKPLLRWIFQDTAPGDHLLLHFSGHGSYTADVNGDEHDNRDEMICLYDMDFNNKESYFIDDELRDWTRKLPKGGHLTVVLDSCHSGTGTRKILPPESLEPPMKHPSIIERATNERRAARGITRSLSLTEPHDHDLVIARFVEPPLEIRKKVQGTRPSGMMRREITAEMNHILLAACRDDQTAADAYINGQFNGAFTFNLCNILSTPGGAELSRRDLIEKLTAALAAGHYDQVPQLEGPSDQGPLFGGKKGAETTISQPDDQGPTSIESSPDSSGSLQTVTGVPNATSPTPILTPGSDLPKRMEEFLAAYNRVLAAGGALASSRGAIARADTGRPVRSLDLTGQKVLVYVHGICQHSQGFSNDWWTALSPYVPDLQPGDLGMPGETDSKRYEVIWSDLVRGGARDLSVSPTRAAANKETRQRIVEVLEDRARQQAVAFAATQPQQSGSDRSLETQTMDRALFEIPFLDCINDFVQYLEDLSIRQQVQERFFKVVSPLLRAEAQVEVISHSWGTVVAYESLCLLETVVPKPAGEISNFFTVGSALSIGYVKNRLIAAAIDGHRPSMVRNWANLDARGDIVGGPLRGFPFAVDQEFLNLNPVGCNPLLPSPSCAHGSYFDPNNCATNRDIFGRLIAT
jgi:hypothetical protein